MSKCPTCNRDYKGFVDDKSLAEYKISGMCQACQDEVFGKPELDRGMPTGKCRNCGNMCYEGDMMCSTECDKEYMEYLNAGVEDDYDLDEY